MYYYKILVSSQDYHGHEALTYSYEKNLPIGSVVSVPMRKKKHSAIVVGKTSKPAFIVKPISRLLLNQPIPEPSLKLLSWLKDYYPSSTGVITSQFLPNNLLRSEQETSTLKLPSKLTSLPPLTPDQDRAISIISDIEPGSSCILHGDTGTGKTRVYIELIKQAIVNKQHCLILTPEIGLTTQLAATISESVGVDVVIIHSDQSGKQRRTAWLKVLNATTPIVVIGPRSALFVPFKNLGLIVVDESHDTAYKQDQSPYYFALRVASKLAEIQKARLIFGSATPLISEYFVAKQKKVPIIRMTQLAVNHLDDIKPQIVIVDQTDRSQFTHHGNLSNPMISSIRDSIDKNEQSLIFLNRRGTARLVMCQDCGWQELCPNCDLPLTYHADKHTLVCHTCGYKKSVTTSCPTCGSSNIIYKSMGTKAIADSLQRLFPGAKIKRFDTDNDKSDSLDKQYDQIKNGVVDILVGTQMLVKGHDLPNLSTVGIVSADSSLNFPDFTSEEQTYQLLAQAIGRVGRGHRTGNVVIQTYNTSGTTLLAAVNKNWDEFYEQQIIERRRYLFPPFCFVLKLSCRRKTKASAMRASITLAEKIRGSKVRVKVLGPTPSFKEMVNGEYSWQIIIKAKNRSYLTSMIHDLPANWVYDIDPVNLL